MRGSFVLGLATIAFLALPAACSSTPENESSSTGESSVVDAPPPPNANDVGGVVITSAGGGVRSSDDVLSVVIPQGALDESVTIAVLPWGTGSDGPKGTPRYRIVMTPSVVELHAPAQVTMDLSNVKTSAPELAFAGMRLAASGESTSPEMPLVHPQKSKLSLTQFVGATFQLEHVYGLVEGKAISCGNTGQSCNTCCIDVNEFTCSAMCITEPGKIAVDCLKDADCGGGGLKCCTPTTQRAGGVLRVDDNRITCRAECEGENLHVCDLTDPNHCSTCTAARPGCNLGFCGDGAKTPVQLVCPN